MPRIHTFERYAMESATNTLSEQQSCNRISDRRGRRNQRDRASHASEMTAQKEERLRKRRPREWARKAADKAFCELRLAPNHALHVTSNWGEHERA